MRPAVRLHREELRPGRAEHRQQRPSPRRDRHLAEDRRVEAPTYPEADPPEVPRPGRYKLLATPRRSRHRACPWPAIDSFSEMYEWHDAWRVLRIRPAAPMRPRLSPDRTVPTKPIAEAAQQAHPEGRAARSLRPAQRNRDADTLARSARTARHGEGNILLYKYWPRESLACKMAVGPAG
jgi:hypothetical protein